MNPFALVLRYRPVDRYAFADSARGSNSLNLAPISAFDRLPQETDLKKEVTWKEKESFEHKEKWSDSWEGETATCSVYAA